MWCDELYITISNSQYFMGKRQMKSIRRPWFGIGIFFIIKFQQIWTWFVVKKYERIWYTISYARKQLLNWYQNPSKLIQKLSCHLVLQQTSGCYGARSKISSSVWYLHILYLRMWLHTFAVQWTTSVHRNWFEDLPEISRLHWSTAHFMLARY